MHATTRALSSALASGIAPTATICTAPGDGRMMDASLASCTASSLVGATTSTRPKSSSSSGSDD